LSDRDHQRQQQDPRGDGWAFLPTGKSTDEARAAIVSRNPQQRLVRPEEVANATLWLCMPGSEAITGQAIAVAGGELL